MRSILMTILLICPLLVRADLAPPTSQASQNPCGGPGSLLAELDRPTVGDSACVVPQSRAIVEFGFADAQGSTGTTQNGPQAELRFGLPGDNEFVLMPPNVTFAQGSLGGTPRYSPTVMGVKHEWGYTRQWIYTGEVLLTMPATGYTPGTQGGLGAAANGIVGWNITHAIALGLMLGVTSFDDANQRRFTSINPDFTATWLLDPRLQLYGEIYGQTHTSYHQGPGWDSDGGIQYLLTRHVEVDAEIGQRISGALGGYRHYWGIGAGWEF